MLYIVVFYVLAVFLIGELLFFFKRKNGSSSALSKFGMFAVFALTLCSLGGISFLFATKRLEPNQVIDPIQIVSVLQQTSPSVPPTAEQNTPTLTPSKDIVALSVTPTVLPTSPTPTKSLSSTPTTKKSPTPTTTIELPKTGGPGDGTGSQTAVIVQPQLPVAGFFQPTVLLSIAGFGLFAVGFLF